MTFFDETRLAHKVVVVDFGFLGDTIHLVPALREIHRNYAEAELHVVTTPVGSEVLKMVPEVARVHVCQQSNFGIQWYESLGLVAHLRRERFGALFNFNGADRTLYFSSALGIRNKFTVKPNRHHFYNFLFSRFWVERETNFQIPVYISKLNMLRSAGLCVSEQADYRLRVPENVMQEARKYLCSGAIHLSPNTSTSAKEWSLARWVELIRLLRQRLPERAIVISGSKSEREVERLKAIQSCIGQGDGQVRFLPPGLPIPQLAAVVSQCWRHIGGDTGSTHLAWILGVPTVTLYRRYHDVGGWIPRGEKHHCILVDCECNRDGVQNCACSKEPQCLARITAEEVCDACVGR